MIGEHQTLSCKTFIGGPDSLQAVHLFETRWSERGEYQLKFYDGNETAEFSVKKQHIEDLACWLAECAEGDE